MNVELDLQISIIHKRKKMKVLNQGVMKLSRLQAILVSVTLKLG